MRRALAESLDISAYVLKALVNHSQPNSDVTGGYISLDVKRLRAPMQRITDRLRALCDLENVPATLTRLT